MLLYRTSKGPVLHFESSWYSIDRSWNELVNDDSLFETLNQMVHGLEEDSSLESVAQTPFAPMTDQEIWAAGVTYFRSKNARMEESQDAGGGDFYDRVYDAVRPEIFMKATAQRTVGPGAVMHRRKDSKWIVPEPELTLAISRSRKIIGYTIGNDLSCRDIEGENPLYLPQAKSFDRCASIGPAILIAEEPPPKDAQIKMKIMRSEKIIFEEQIEISQIKRGFEELVEFLFRDNSHPNGCMLMTGTGIIPPDEFSLETDDVVEIVIDGIRKLINSMD